MQGLSLTLTFLLSVIPASEPILHELSERHGMRTDGGIHLPLYRRETPILCRRDGGVGTVALGDFLDVTYNVLIQVGGATMPLVVDTGSSDLWAISDTSDIKPPANLPLYPQASFQSTGLDVHLVYGDSHTGSHAYGLIGKDTVNLAGFTLQNQFFAAINDTNTTVLQTGSVGILGLGFPLNSVVWMTVFKSQNDGILEASNPSSRHGGWDERSYTIPETYFRMRSFPNFTFLSPSIPSSANAYPLPRQQPTSPIVHNILASYASLGPFLSRLVAADAIASPMFTITIQRDTVDIGGNQGLLSIGELPEGVNNDTLTWTDVRGYPITQGGLSAPPDAPAEVYPIAWEIFIDDVFLDGQKLPRSSLSSPNITLSALVDTGNSLIRGPSDIVQTIHNMIGGEPFPCTTPHTLAFQIGGRIFPVDPRDFVSQAFTNSVTNCVPNLAVTDTPKVGSGYLYSWSLGDPFLKSVVASFYYGNLSYPSQDPPRIGLLSTVPPDASAEMEAAVSMASANGGNFPSTSDVAPSGTLAEVTLNGTPGPQQTQGHNSSKNGASQPGVSIGIICVTGLAAALVVWKLSPMC